MFFILNYVTNFKNKEGEVIAKAGDAYCMYSPVKNGVVITGFKNNLSLLEKYRGERGLDFDLSVNSINTKFATTKDKTKAVNMKLGAEKVNVEQKPKQMRR